MTGALAGVLAVLALALPTTTVAAVDWWSTGDTTAIGTSAIITALGVVITALAGATTVVLAALERIRRGRSRDQRRTDAELRLLRRQVRWLHRREHDLTLALDRESISVPAPHEPYPADPAGSDDDLEETRS